MVKSKQKSRTTAQILQDASDSLNREQPVIRSRFYIMEVTPSRRYDDEYGVGWTKELRRQVSPCFDTSDEAWEWAEKFEPDDGKIFKCAKENLRRQPPRWVGY